MCFTRPPININALHQFMHSRGADRDRGRGRGDRNCRVHIDFIEASRNGASGEIVLSFGFASPTHIFSSIRCDSIRSLDRSDRYIYLPRYHVLVFYAASTSSSSSSRCSGQLPLCYRHCSDIFLQFDSLTHLRRSIQGKN